MSPLPVAESLRSGVELASGIKRSFLEDGDSLVMRGWCQGDGFRVGFGQVEGTIVAALTREDYACVVVGGGIRKHEPLLEFFERVVNLVRQHAPGAAIAFNSTPEDTADAALRWLR